MCWRRQSCPDMHKSANPEPPGWTWRKHIMYHGCMGQPKPFYRCAWISRSQSTCWAASGKAFLKLPLLAFTLTLGCGCESVCLICYTVMALYSTTAIPIKVFPRGQGPHFVAISHGGSLQTGWVLVKICSYKMRCADTWVYNIPFWREVFWPKFMILKLV